jgi:POT family proton-dependent oligopeptide transporter
MNAERHPKGLYVLFFTEMWERFGFYSMLAMFTLYLKDPSRGLGWDAEEATRLYANYLMFVYASPLIGGWIADKKLGYRNSVLIGGLVFMVGYFLLSIRSAEAVYAALTCLVIGNGFFKPNVSAMVGHLYPEGSALKDRAYNIFYMGINIGALLAPINAEFMVNGFSFNLRWLGLTQSLVFQGIGFNWAFAIAGFGMIVSVAILWAFKHYVEGHGELPAPALPSAGGDPQAVAVTEGIPPMRRANPIDAVPDATRVGALVVIFALVIVFWMVFHQNGSTITYWADDNTNWNVSGIISNAINPFWVVVLTFPLVWFWGWLNSKGLEPSTPAKMTLGMFMTAASFGILYLAARTGETAEVPAGAYASGEFRITDRTLRRLEAEGVPAGVIESLNRHEVQKAPFLWLFETTKTKYLVKGKKFETDEKSSGEQKLTEALQGVLTSEQLSEYMPKILRHSYLFLVSPLWLILAVAVVTLGELMLSPMGLSLVSKVAPVHLRGLMMGGWFVATAIGNKLTMIGVYWDVWLQSTFFAVLGGMALAMGVVLLVLLRPLKKAMPGV